MTSFFTKAENNYTLSKTSVSVEDAGVYTMNHTTLGQNTSCFSVLLVAGKLNNYDLFHTYYGVLHLMAALKSLFFLIQ